MDYIFNKDHKLTPSYLQKKFYKINYSLSKEAVNYWAVLPNFVEQFSTLEKDVERLGVKLIGQYVSKNETFLDVEVFYEHLDYDINPSDWLLRKVVKLKETVLAENEVKDKSTGIYNDLLTYKETDGADKFISRITVKKNFDMQLGGANYMALRVMCREEEYNNLADMMLHTAYNWDFKDKGTWQLAERIIPLTIPLYNNTISFYTFESWKVYGEDVKPLTRLILHQTDNSDNKGAINIIETKPLNKDNVKDVFDAFINRVTLTSIELDELKEVTKSILNPKITHAWTTQGLIKNADEQFEGYVIAYLIQTEKSGYYIESISSSPNFENYNWEINKRQVEMILNSFNNPSFEQEQKKEAIEQIIITPNINKGGDEKSDFKKSSIFFK
ncbi:hypothetical protein MUGA111182_05350 [Mucilaginibacter galii]|uniref:Uncharacterized protein n=1 Tax=Mucilaginibacter galii TaxID=2005073 RepID=A0A917J712_9SPHI|nr:hypothetical protein [Mucilaginibacter galii]GGI49888.1 hypothetical protein GCM10011425_11000 [Mucilaginibacter galii]